jgi:colanic acid/amylovoran biosynthesis glycosyltransferase
VRIAMIMCDFPTVSETFVLGHITGLLDCGHEVDVYAQRRGESDTVHPDVERYGLLARTRWDPPTPDNLGLRALRGVGLLARMAARDPRRAMAALNVRRNGRAAAGLRLLYMGVPFTARPAYDAILCHFGPYGAKGLELRDAGLVEGRLATVFHGFDVSSLLRDEGEDAYARLFERGDLFLPVSDFWRRRLIALGCPPSRTRVQRMGIDPTRFPFAARRPSADAPRTVRVLSVARLIEKKGVEYAIRAVAAVRATGIDVSYRVIGEGPLRPELERLIAELGAEHYVELVGTRTQTEVARAMAEAHLFLAPSVTAANGDMEGIPVSLMEAMATGLPVISTHHSGIPELVDDGKSGCLVHERDVAELTDALGQLAGHPERWPEMGEYGRRKVESDYDARTLVERLALLLAGNDVTQRAPEESETRRAAALASNGRVAPDNPAPRAEMVRPRM